MWRVRKNNKDEAIHCTIFHIAIMRECGTSPMTITNNMKALKKLGWLKNKGKTKYTLTGKDLVEN